MVQLELELRPRPACRVLLDCCVQWKLGGFSGTGGALEKLSQSTDGRDSMITAAMAGF